MRTIYKNIIGGNFMNKYFVVKELRDSSNYLIGTEILNSNNNSFFDSFSKTNDADSEVNGYDFVYMATRDYEA